MKESVAGLKSTLSRYLGDANVLLGDNEIMSSFMRSHESISIDTIGT